MGQRDRAQWISGRICCPEQTDCTRNRRPDAGSAPSHAQRKASRPDAIVGRRSSFLILENLLDVVALPFTSRALSERTKVGLTLHSKRKRPLTRSLSLGATAHCHSPIDPGVDVSYECSAFFPTSSFTLLHDSHDRLRALRVRPSPPSRPPPPRAPRHLEQPRRLISSNRSTLHVVLQPIALLPARNASASASTPELGQWHKGTRHALRHSEERAC